MSQEAEGYFQIYKTAFDNFYINNTEGEPTLGELKEYLLNGEEDRDEHFVWYIKFNQEILSGKSDETSDEDRLRIDGIMQLIRELFELICAEKIPNSWIGKEELYKEILLSIFQNFDARSKEKITQCLIAISYFEFSHGIPVQQSNLYSLVMDCLNSPDQNLINFALFFLKSLMDNDPDSKLAIQLSETFCDKLLDLLKTLPIEEELDGDTGSSGNLEKTLQIATAVSLRSLFAKNPIFIFEKIQTFYNDNIGDDNWVHVNAALYSIIGICNTSAINEKERDTIKEFIFENPFNHAIIHAGENSMKPRTKGTALLVLTQLINDNLVEIDEESFPILFQLFQHTILNQFHLFIVKRGCNLFSILAKTCDKIYLDDCYEEAAGSIFQSIQIYHESEDFPEFITPLFSALIGLIKYTSSTLDQNILGLLNQLFDAFDQLPECEKPLVCLLASSIFAKYPGSLIENEMVIQYLLKLLIILQPILGVPHGFPEDFAQLPPFGKELPENLAGLPGIEILQVPNQPQQDPSGLPKDFPVIWENCLIAMCYLMNSKLPDIQYLSLPIFSSIYNALITGNESLILASIHSLGKFFDIMYSIRSKQDDEKPAFQTIMAIFTSNYPIDTKECPLQLLFPYYDLLGNFFQFGYPLNDENNEEFIQTIFDSSERVLNLSSYDDIYNFIEMLFFVFIKIFIGFGDVYQEFLSGQFKTSILPFFEIIDSQELYSEKVFNVLFVLIKVMGEKIGKRINVYLNKTKIRNLVKKGGEQFEKFKVTADQLLKFMENL